MSTPSSHPKKKREGIKKKDIQHHAHACSRTEMVWHATEEAFRKCLPEIIKLKRSVRGIPSSVSKLRFRFARIVASYWYSKKGVGGNSLTKRQRQVLETLKAQVKPEMARRAAKCGMVLEDDVFVRYLRAANWRLEFPDRPVVEALEHTIQWRSSTPVVSRPQSINPRRDLLEAFHTPWRPPILTARGEYLLAFHCAKTPKKVSVNLWSDHLVHTVESALRQCDYVSVVVDGRGCSPRRLLEAAKTVAPAFNELRTHYCGRLGRVYVLGSGKGVLATWWFVKKFLDERTRDKIFFVHDARKLIPYIHHRDHKRLLAALDDDH